MKNIIIAICLLFIVGCETVKDRVKNHPSFLPPGATNVEYLDDNWAKFEFDGQSYLFTFADTTSSMNYIPIKKSNNDGKTFKCPHCGSKIVITDLGPVEITER